MQSEGIARYYPSRLSRSLDLFSKVGDYFDYLISLISSVGMLISHVSAYLGKGASLTAQRVSHKFGETRLLLGVLRVLNVIEGLVTLKFLYQRNADGTLARERGKARFHDALDIAAILSLYAGRICSTVSALHHYTIVNLGKHTANIGHAATVAYTALSTFGFISATRRFINAFSGGDTQSLRASAIQLAQDSAYLLMTIPESGAMMGPSAHPVLGIIGSCFCIAGSITVLATNILQINGFTVNKDALSSPSFRYTSSGK